MCKYIEAASAAWFHFVESRKLIEKDATNCCKLILDYK